MKEYLYLINRMWLRFSMSSHTTKVRHGICKSASVPSPYGTARPIYAKSLRSFMTKYQFFFYFGQTRMFLLVTLSMWSCSPTFIAEIASVFFNFVKASAEPMEIQYRLKIWLLNCIKLKMSIIL